MKLRNKLPVKRPASLQELFSNDPNGLLEGAGKAKISMTVSEKVSAKLEKIKQFIIEKQRLPDENSDDFEERLLYSSYRSVVSVNAAAQDECEALLPEELRSVRKELQKRSTLTRDELIKKEVEQLHSRLFNDINSLADADPLGLLNDDGADETYVVEHEYWRDTEHYKARKLNIKEEAARATQCSEFQRFAPYFNEVKRLLKEGHYEARKIVGGGDEINIEPGEFFIIDGIMSLIVEGSPDGMKSNDNTSNKRRYRVRQIFDNGMESRPFSTSIKTSFYTGLTPSLRLVPTDDVGREFLQRLVNEVDPLFNELENSNKPDGYVYILDTLSTDPVIVNFKTHSHLIKIGYTSTTVEDRIANAENESTYLYAPVKVLCTIACKNFDAHALEQALHTVLAPMRPDITLKDSNGKTYRPKEWFTVSVDTACKVVEHIMAKDLHKFYIDRLQGKLKLKK